MSNTRRIVTPAAVLLLLGAAPWPVLAQEQMHNRGRYDVWVAFGQHRDGSIAGLGNNGWTDPNAGLYTHMWTQLKAGSSIDIPREYSGWVRVVAVGPGGGHRAVRPLRPMNGQPYPIMKKESGGGTAAVKTGSVGNPAAVTKAIQDAGFRAAQFLPLDAYRHKNGAPVEVLASEESQRDLDQFFGTRNLAVVALVNESSSPVTFKFRWGPGGGWQSKTLPAGHNWMWWTGAAAVKPEVQFDEGVGVGGSQVRTVSLRPFDVRLPGAATDPRLEDASQYKFVTSGNRLKIYER